MATRTLNYYEIYKNRRKDLLDLGREQLSVVNALEIDKNQAEGVKPGEVLNGILDRLETDTLRVLVMGRFSAGKSTFLNALFGDRILPSSPAPTTGVICEIRYADNTAKKATLFPKPGMGENGKDKPFDIDNIRSLHEELCKYVKINHSEDGMTTSKYQKLELQWPLPLCQDGVELIDSVGLDDPDAREAVTMEYAKSADAILYCMSSTQAYTAKDKVALELLRSVGYENIFFIITYYDHIKDSAERGETTEETFRKDMAKNLTRWTELKNDGIKYVDSRSALLGRMKKSPALIQQSGIEEIEENLGRFLTQEKGRAKLQTSLRSLRSINRQVRTVIPSRIGMWQTPNKELEERYKAAKPRLDNLEQTRRLIIESAALSVRDIGRRAKDLALEHFEGMPNEIKAWAKNYEIETDFGIPPKVQPVVEEIVDHLKSKIQIGLGNWTNESLVPAVQEGVQALVVSLEGRTADFFYSIDEIRIELSRGPEFDPEGFTQVMRPSKAARVIAIVDGVIRLDPFSAGAGMFMGLRAMLTTIVAQVVVAVIASLFLGPGMIPVFIGLIAGGGAGFMGNMLHLKERIKATVADKLAADFDSRKRELAEEVRAKVEEHLRGLQKTLDDALATEMASVRGDVEKILEEQRQGRANASQKIAELEKLNRHNTDIEERLEKLLFEAGIGA